MFFKVIFLSALAIGLSLAVPLGLQPRDLSHTDIRVGQVLAAWPTNMEPDCIPPHMRHLASTQKSHPMIVMSIDAPTGTVRVSPISSDNPLNPHMDIAHIVGTHSTLKGQVYTGRFCEIHMAGVKIWSPAVTLTPAQVETLCQEITRNQIASMVRYGASLCR
jgi:hypothetical protein